jgi:hypothetical protein
MRGRTLAAFVGLLLAATAAPVCAIDRITVTAQRVDVAAAGAGARDVRVDFAIGRDEHSVLTATAASLRLPPALQRELGATRAFRLRCVDLVVREPEFACADAAVGLRAARLPPVDVALAAAYRSDTGTLTFRGSGPVVAGARLAFTGSRDVGGWRLAGSLPAVRTTDLAQLARPWFALPAGLQLDGSIAVDVDAHGDGTRLDDANLRTRVSGLALQDAGATLIGEKVAATLEARLSGTPAALAFDARLRGEHGQLLAGPVLLDFDSHALSADFTGRYDARAGTVAIERATVAQAGLLTARGSATLRLAPLAVVDADVDVGELRFPAAYSGYLQIALATTPFGQLATSGTASGALRVRGGMPSAVDVTLSGLGLVDPSRDLVVEKVDAALHWTDGNAGPPRPSFLGWKYSRGFGIEGGEARVDFATRARGFTLVKPARLPLYDGALRIARLSVDHLGSERLEGEFEAEVEPISLLRVSQALGLPPLNGRIAGRIPGVTYRDRRLALAGSLVAQVFDGQFVADNLSVQDPLGAWPRLSADIRARNLDLELITRAFEFGTITGRLDGDITGLRTFGWTPVAFDARFATPPGDRSRHRISQRAVQNLSNIGGGGGGGVAAALQTGLLRFFDTFRYDRIGLACRLENDVCRMSGVGDAKDGGYYIVKGSGLPRIDIIGNQSRVDWPRLSAQIGAALKNSDGIRVD